jgi:hypothetical protein
MKRIVWLLAIVALTTSCKKRICKECTTHTTQWCVETGQVSMTDNTKVMCDDELIEEAGKAKTYTLTIDGKVWHYQTTCDCK